MDQTTKVDLEILKDVVLSFDPCSSAGASGFSVGFVQQLLHVDGGDSLLRELGQVVELVMNGEVPASVRPVLAGARLVALEKMKGGKVVDIRPIAVGEVLRRISAKYFCKIMQTKFLTLFTPTQLGVAAPCGREVIIHSVRAFMEHVQSRDSQDHVQGDPLGPALFSIVIHWFLSHNLPSFEQKWLFYLDDGCFLVKKEELSMLLSSFSSESANSCGLKLNLSKCLIYSPTLPNWAKDFTFNGCRIQSSDIGTVVLGALIGKQEFVNNFIRKNVLEPLEALLSEIHQLEDSQLEFFLIRNCASFCKVSHL